MICILLHRFPGWGGGGSTVQHKDRWKNTVRYSLLVSIEVPDEEVDIYSVVETQVEAQIDVQV